MKRLLKKSGLLRLWLAMTVYLFFAATPIYAQDKVVNVYAWSGEIPDSLVREFENETGIKVNISTYDNNEVMYAKLRATKNPGYDVIMPSSYFVDRMSKQHMLETLDRTKLPNWKNLNPSFLNPAYDPQSLYSIPHIWGITGIFVNKNYFDPNTITKWSDLWEPRFYNQLMVLDDTRELFSMALLKLGYSPNDQNPEHLHQAFEQLKTFMQNVKVFSSDTIVSVMIDEDATVGMAWNGDAFKAQQDNPNIRFIFPKEGFVIWVDTFAMPVSAPHKDTAYQFMNFMMRPDVAEDVAVETSYPTANLAAQKLLPDNIRNNPYVYPPADVMKHGIFQKDIDQNTLTLFEKYWEELKMSG